MFAKADEAAAAIRAKLSSLNGPAQFDAWIVLGSGLGDFASNVQNPVVIPYSEIPNFPKPTVAGHAGRLVVGDLAGHKVIVQQGRWHLYEGHSACDVVIGIRVMRALGVGTLVVTNAAGGINTERLGPCSLMLMSDHINLMGDNPLVGANEEKFGQRFPDMTHAYTPELRRLAREAAKEVGVKLEEGVYAALRGPSYETPAEIRMLRVMGADAVGMSTVPEVIAASHQGSRVVGISCITNMAAGILNCALDHKEVQETANKAAADFTKLLIRIVSKL